MFYKQNCAKKFPRGGSKIVAAYISLQNEEKMDLAIQKICKDFNVSPKMFFVLQAKNQSLNEDCYIVYTGKQKIAEIFIQNYYS